MVVYHCSGDDEKCVFPANFNEETREQADMMLDWSKTSDLLKKERIEECLKYIHRIITKRHLVIII